MAAMSQDRLVGEFHDLLRERADAKYNGRLHQSFVDWFIDAEFGRVDWKFTDDVGDGGIDAVVWLPHDDPPVAILQSKFTENNGRSMLSGKAYRRLNEVVNAFYLKGDAFDEFLSKVRADARPIYRKASQLLEKCGDWRIQKRPFGLSLPTSADQESELSASPQPI